MKKLPQTVYVAWREAIGPGDSYLIAEQSREDAIEDEGPTIVGTYRLVEQTELRMVVEQKPVRGRRR
jgi:hypothetical protein